MSDVTELRGGVRLTVGGQEIDIWNGTATPLARECPPVFISALVTGNQKLRGYGTTVAEAIVDLLRVKRDHVGQGFEPRPGEEP